MKEIDARTRQIDKLRVNRGNEYSVRQQAQNQLMAIRAEQRRNIATSRAEGQALAQSNTNLAQAGAVAAEVASEGQSVEVNPQTQQLLAQYGYNNPGISKTTQRSNQQITKQNVTINNYTTTTNTTNTTNHVGGPTQGRAVSVSNNGLPKFKVWLNNTLAQQNELAQKRDKIYEKREAELERNANRMQRKMEASSNSLFERLDPRNIGKTVKSSLKTILIMFGLHLFANNFEGFMTKMADWIEKFNNFFGIGLDENQQSGLKKVLVKVLGGDEGKGLTDTLKGLGTTIVDLLKDAFRDFINDRKNAIDTIKKPDKGLVRDTGSWMDYFGNLLRAALLGSEGLAKSWASDENREGRRAVESKDDATGDEYRREGIYLDKKRHLDKEGNLIGSSGAAALSKQFKITVNEGLKDYTGEIKTSEILTILRMIHNDLEKHGSLDVPAEFYQALKKIGIDIPARPAKELGKYVKNDDGSIDIAPMSDQRLSGEAAFGKSDTLHLNPVKLYTLTQDDMSKIKNKLGEKTGLKENFSFDAKDEASLIAFDRALKTQKKSVYDSDTRRIKSKLNLESDIDLERKYELERLAADYKAEKEKNKQDLEDSQVGKAVEGTKEVVHKAKEKAENAIGKVVDLGEHLFTAAEEAVDGRVDESSESGEPEKFDETNPDGWSISKTIEYLKKHKKKDGEDKGDCALYVRRALNAGGLFPAKGHAFTYLDGRLEKIGFKKLPTVPRNVKDYKPGDILVTDKFGKHDYGHISVWAGTNWFSDFKQPRWDGTVYKDPVDDINRPTERSHQRLFRFDPKLYQEAVARLKKKKENIPVPSLEAKVEAKPKLDGSKPEVNIPENNVTVPEPKIEEQTPQIHQDVAERLIEAKKEVEKLGEEKLNQLNEDLQVRLGEYENSDKKFRGKKKISSLNIENISDEELWGKELTSSELNNELHDKYVKDGKLLPFIDLGFPVKKKETILEVAKRLGKYLTPSDRASLKSTLMNRHLYPENDDNYYKKLIAEAAWKNYRDYYNQYRSKQVFSSIDSQSKSATPESTTPVSENPEAEIVNGNSDGDNITAEPVSVESTNSVSPLQISQSSESIVPEWDLVTNSLRNIEDPNTKTDTLTSLARGMYTGEKSLVQLLCETNDQLINIGQKIDLAKIREKEQVYVQGQ